VMLRSLDCEDYTDEPVCLSIPALPHAARLPLQADCLAMATAGIRSCTPTRSRGKRSTAISTTKRLRTEGTAPWELDADRRQWLEAKRRSTGRSSATSLAWILKASPVSAGLLAEYLWSPVATGRTRIEFVDPRTCFREHEWFYFNRRARENIDAATTSRRVEAFEPLVCRLLRGSRGVEMAIMVGIKERSQSVPCHVRRPRIHKMCGNFQRHYPVAWGQAGSLEQAVSSDTDARVAAEALAAAERATATKREQAARLDALAAAASTDDAGGNRPQQAPEETAVIWVENRHGVNRLHIDHNGGE